MEDKQAFGAHIFTSTAQSQGAPGYPERTGQTVDILRPLAAGESDEGEVGPMFRIRFADGQEADAFADELSPAPLASPADALTVRQAMAIIADEDERDQEDAKRWQRLMATWPWGTDEEINGADLVDYINQLKDEVV